MNSPSSRSFAVPAPVWRHVLLLAFLPVAALSPGQANAQEEDDWQAMLGAGAIYAPDYEGSDEYEVMPFPFVAVSYRDLLYVRGPEIGLNLVRLKPTDDLKINLGPIARYRRDRSEDRNDDLRGLGDVDMAIELGGALAVEHRNAWVRVEVAQDVAGGHEGLVAEGQAGIRFDLAERLGASVSAQASWADTDYMATYFNVSPAQSAASGLRVYQAGSGLKDAGASLGLNYRLGGNWMISAIGGYTRLLGDAGDAPLVRERGSLDQWQGGLFIAYRF